MTVAVVSCSNRFFASGRQSLPRVANSSSEPSGDHSNSAFSAASVPAGSAIARTMPDARSHSAGSNRSLFSTNNASRLLSGDHLKPRTCRLSGNTFRGVPVVVSMIETSTSDGAM